MYLAVKPAETAMLEKLTELVGVILENAARLRPPGPPDFQALEPRLPSEVRSLVSRPSIRGAIEAVYRLPYSDRLAACESFQNDIDFPRHMDDGGYCLSDLSAASEKGYSALKDLCLRLYQAAAQGIPDPRAPESKEKLFSSALLRRRYRALNSAFGRVCPVCVREIYYSDWEGDVDHYFPKSAHPALAFHPYNLLPTCADCNGLKNKSAKEPIDREDAGAGGLRTVFLPYLRPAAQEAALSVTRSRDADQDLKIAITPGPQKGPWTQKRIQNMDRLYHLSSRWSGVLEYVVEDVREEALQKCAAGITPEAWLAALREILRANAQCTRGRVDFIKGVYFAWLSEQSDEELMEALPPPALGLPPEQP